MGKFPAFFMIMISYVLVVHFTRLNKHVLAESDQDDESCDFPAIFNFGDGNSDTGALSAVFSQAPPPFGISYFGGPRGRYSDGRLLIDFIASSLGNPFLHPYLDSLGADFSQGANSANILSTIALPKLVIPIDLAPRAYNPIFLDIQIGHFTQFINRTQTIRQQGGVFKNLMTKIEYFSKALYTIDIGQSDISQGLFAGQTFDQVKAIIPDLINRITNNIRIIYSLGGRSFWVHNTGPIGCLPYVLTLAPVSDDQLDSVGCAKPYNELCQYFNSELKKGVAQLRKDLPLGAFTYVDVYTPKYALYHQPATYGFKLPFIACCGYGGKYNYDPLSFCGSTRNGTQVPVTSCENPSGRINWDGIEYTEAADKITFSKISSGKYSDPPNTSLKQACPVKSSN